MRQERVGGGVLLLPKGTSLDKGKVVRGPTSPINDLVGTQGNILCHPSFPATGPGQLHRSLLGQQDSLVLPEEVRLTSVLVSLVPV